MGLSNPKAPRRRVLDLDRSQALRHNYHSSTWCRADLWLFCKGICNTGMGMTRAWLPWHLIGFCSLLLVQLGSVDGSICPFVPVCTIIPCLAVDATRPNSSQLMATQYPALPTNQSIPIKEVNFQSSRAYVSESINQSSKALRLNPIMI